MVTVIEYVLMRGAAKMRIRFLRFVSAFFALVGTTHGQAKDSKDAPAYFERGYAWLGKMEFDKAIADFDEAIRLDPENASAFFARGLAWSHKKQYGKAIADYDEVVRIEPRYSWAYNSRAWLWATCPDKKHRDGKRAVESATRACELTEWQEASVIDTLAASYAEAGDFDRAVEFQVKTLKLYTDEEDRRKGAERLKLYREKTSYHEQG